MQWLQENGESEALLSRRQGVYRNTIEAMAPIYNTLFSEEGKIHATIELINFAGWKYHES